MSEGIRRNSPENETRAVRAALLSMRDEDARVRDELVAEGTLWDKYHPRMEAVHLRNATRLTRIFEELGWPDSDRFDRDGEDAAWLILMHSISVPDLRPSPTARFPQKIP
jgi:hypothetical protein